MAKSTITTMVLLFVTLLSGCTMQPYYRQVKGMPNLPYPIARERALVTTAGQGIDGLIVAKYASQLNIRNYYRYHAESVDLQDVRSLIIAIGFSPNGLASAYMDVKEEQKRLRSLVATAKQAQIPIILIHLGGTARRSPLNDATAEELAKNASYLIVVQNSNKDDFFTKLAGAKHLPFTEVSSMDGIKVPLNSAYR